MAITTGAKYTRVGWDSFSIFDRNRRLSWKWYEISHYITLQIFKVA